MLAQDRMSRDIRAVLPDLSVWAALTIMRQEEIRHLLVMEGERLVGVLSNRDYRRILEWARPDGSVQNLTGFTVARIMTPHDRLVTVQPSTPMLEVAKLMVTRKVGCVPVLDAQHRPVGLLTQKDVMAALVDVISMRGGKVERAMPASRGATLRGKRVLIVDDEAEFRTMLVEYLQGKGCGALGVADGGEALRHLLEFRPHLVLLDISMPGLSGVETLQRIKALAPQIPVVMVSSSEDLETARETLATGALDYVAKPVDFAYLDAVLDAHLLIR